MRDFGESPVKFRIDDKCKFVFKEIKAAKSKNSVVLSYSFEFATACHQIVPG